MQLVLPFHFDDLVKMYFLIGYCDLCKWYPKNYWDFEKREFVNNRYNCHFYWNYYA